MFVEADNQILSTFKIISPLHHRVTAKDSPYTAFLIYTIWVLEIQLSGYQYILVQEKHENKPALDSDRVYLGKFKVKDPISKEKVKD